LNELTETISGTIKYLEAHTIQRNSLGALITALLAMLVWVNQGKRIARREAEERIIVGFQPELDAMIQTNEDARLILTDEAFNKHEAIIRNNKRSLTYLQQIRLNSAWDDLAYYQKGNKQKIPSYVMYADCGSLDKRREIRPLAIARIQNIISIVS